MMDASIRYLTPQQVREFDRWAVEQLGIPSIVLMENAGRNAAEIIDHFMGDRRCNTALVVCGTGNNGGDGFVVARHLANRGRSVSAALVGNRERLTPDCRANRDIVVAMRISVIEVTHADDAARIMSAMNGDTLVIDALLGTGFSGAVREPLASAIRAMNDGPKAGVVAIDVPSGLNATTGDVEGVAVKADLTITFVALKSGFGCGAASRYLGHVHVVDIGAPMNLAARALGLA